MTQIDNRESGLSVRTKLNQIFDTAESAVQPADIGTAAAEDVGTFATATQGDLADTSVQPADIGTAAPLDVAASGDAAIGEVVKGDDTRLSDARTPTTHTHTKSDITDFIESDYATGAEGDLAATALQSGDAVEQTSATGSAVLPVGTTAQRDGTPSTGYLRYNSTDGSPEVYDGAEWAPVGGGGGGLVFIASSDLSSDATADFTAFDGTKYDAYKFVLQNVIPATDSVKLYMRTSTDGGATFDSGASDYLWNASQLSGSGNDFDIGSTGDTSIQISEFVNSALAGVSGSIVIAGPHLAKRTQTTFNVTSGYQSASVMVLFGGGERVSSADVDAVRFLFSSGNIASGTITMYGMVNA